jgi:integrase
MDIKRVCQFLLDKESGKPDAKLRYRVKWNGNRNIAAFNVGHRVDVDKWSTDTQRCKINTTHGKKKVAANVINRAIRRFEAASDNVFSDFERRGIIPEAETFRLRFNIETGRADEAPDKSFFDYFDEFVRREGNENQWSKATFQKMATVRKHLRRFDENLSFEKLDETQLNNYVACLRNELEMRNRTVVKQLNVLKWFLRWSVKKGYNHNAAFQTFAPKLRIEEKKVIFLDWEELQTVYNFNIPERYAHLETVRDAFCFCCFTSLRYSDMANLRRSDVSDTHISLTTIKTADDLKIESNDYSRAVLRKYAGAALPDNHALPVISNRKMNGYLKELGKLCGPDKPITITYYKGGERIDEIRPKYELPSTHAGRRTFIRNAPMLGIVPQVIMDWTGHSDYNAMKPYIAISDKAREEAMNLFNKAPSLKTGTKNA